MEYGVPDERADKGYKWISFLYNPLIKEPVKIFRNQKIKVLDIGTGSGYLLRLLKKKNLNWDLNGVDPDRTSLDLNKESGINLVEGNVEELPFMDESFDLILSKSSFCYWEDGRNGLEEIKRVLKKDGKVYIMDVNKSKFFKMLLIIFGKLILNKGKKDMADFSDRAYSIKEVKDIFSKSGLKFKVRKLFGGSYYLVKGCK
tara:strand:+ start:1775 stop:2377 length:603 start_codon:yes stop_codon:yes gene_type:complete